MHVLPQLRKLEEKYSDTIAVIGVHSAKFDAERDNENVLSAVRRYKIAHPVVNDAGFAIWSAYAVRAWPTLMFIDPQGKVIGKHEGEFQHEALDQVIANMVSDFDSNDWLSRKKLPFDAGIDAEPGGTLSFPGKLLAAHDGNLYIADSNHHRVIVASTDGKIQRIIGNGTSSFETFASPDDAGILNPIGHIVAFDNPVFDNPQGMALVGDTLYVADAGAHTIVRADLATETAQVIAGTGEQALFRHNGGDATSFPLNSPYDLAVKDNVLHIAMSGTHQLWQMDTDTHQTSPFAGNGIEGIQDALRLDAMLAQPYGMALDGNNLFFADSETSAIRVAKLGNGGRVVTLTGTGLFDFGDQDGIGKDASLQHPQDVASSPHGVYIADSYNHKIRLMDLNTLKITTVAGSGERGCRDGDALDATFDEPAGISYADGYLYIADTNNHALRKFLIADATVETIHLK